MTKRKPVYDNTIQWSPPPPLKQMFIAVHLALLEWRRQIRASWLAGE